MNGKRQRTRQECLAWLRENPRDIAPGQKIKIGVFQPEDAEGVARLYYAIYGDKFPLDYVYDPEKILEANQGPDLYQVVGKTASGEVVGLSALFKAPPNESFMEFGSLMVLPEYRAGRLAYELMRMTMTDLPPRLGLQGVYGQSVCDHLVTQKLSERFGSHVFALEMESIPARPGIEGGANGRNSLLNEFVILQDAPQTLYLPQVYNVFLRGVYALNGLKRDFAAQGSPAGETRWDASDYAEASLAKMVVHEPGVDFSSALGSFEAAHPGRYAYHLHLPLAHSGSPVAVEAARGRGYFLGGLLPFWAGQDVLLMQKIAASPDFSTPKLYSDGAKAILEFITQDYATVS
ncbi:MAG: GNAT family N-acetyltransferase [Desulfocurvibacter africanus]